MLKRRHARVSALVGVFAATLAGSGQAQQSTTASYDDWTVRCVMQPGPPAKKVCHMEQLARLPDKTEPISRVAHVITNIRLADPISMLDEGAKATTKCRFIVYRNRLESETDLLIGRREDTLTRVGGELKVARRKIILDQSVLLAKNLTMFF